MDESGIGGAVLVIYLGAIVFMIASMWKVFSKAGEAGWQCLIPIWNYVVMLRISSMNPWMVLLMLIPIVNIVVIIMMYLNMAKAFGYGAGFAIGLTFLPFIFLPMLAFGSSKYTAP